MVMTLLKTLSKHWKRFSKNLLLICCAIMFSKNLVAQHHFYLQGGFQNGFILSHSPSLNHLVKDHPVSFTTSIYKKHIGNKPWHHLNNYPDAGVTFIYLNYFNPVLGESFGLIPNYKFHFGHPEKRYNLDFIIGIGPSYHTTPYNRETNNKNVALGSHLSYGVTLGFENDFQVSRRLSANLGLNMTHFSNGSTHKPNAGINIISLALGATYRLDNADLNYTEDTTRLPELNKFGITTVLTGGFSEAVTVGSGTYPFWNLAVLGVNRIKGRRTIGIGFEYFHTLSLKEEIKYDYFLFGRRLDFRRLAILGHFEKLISDISIFGQAGFYIYSPYQPYEPFYVRVGLRHKVTERLFAGLSVKSHYFKAEAAEWSIGYHF